jgi:hypothetical protein
VVGAVSGLALGAGIGAGIGLYFIIDKIVKRK